MLLLIFDSGYVPKNGGHALHCFQRLCLVCLVPFISLALGAFCCHTRGLQLSCQHGLGEFRKKTSSPPVMSATQAVQSRAQRTP